MSNFDPHVPPRVTTGDLLRRTGRLLADHWRFALGIGILTSLLFTAAQFFSISWWFLRRDATGAEIPTFLADQNLWTGAAVMWVVSLATTTVAGAWLHHGMLEAVSGRPIRPAASLRAGLRHAFWYFVALAGIGIATLGGFILCVIPAFLVLAATAVALPALIAEDLRAFRAVDRSLQLTYGHRMSIFFAVVLTWLAMLPVGLVGNLVAMAVSNPHAWTAISVVTNLLNGLLWVVPWTLVVVAYHDLRVFSEGYRDDAVAAVFD